MLLGKLGWSPSDLWAATLTEAFAAIDGFAEFHGAAPPPAPSASKVGEMMLKHPDPPKGKRL